MNCFTIIYYKELLNTQIYALFSFNELNTVSFDYKEQKKNTHTQKNRTTIWSNLFFLEHNKNENAFLWPKQTSKKNNKKYKVNLTNSNLTYNDRNVYKTVWRVQTTYILLQIEASKSKQSACLPLCN